MQDREAGECGARALPTTKTISLSLAVPSPELLCLNYSRSCGGKDPRTLYLSLSSVSVSILLLIPPRSLHETFVTSVRALISVAIRTPPRRLEHDVTDLTGECQHQYSFTEFPHNSPPQAP